MPAIERTSSIRTTMRPMNVSMEEFSWICLNLLEFTWIRRFEKNGLRTDRRTNGRTNGPTDGRSDGWTKKKKKKKKKRKKKTVLCTTVKGRNNIWCFGAITYDWPRQPTLSTLFPGSLMRGNLLSLLKMHVTVVWLRKYRCAVSSMVRHSDTKIIRCVHATL